MLSAAMNLTLIHCQFSLHFFIVFTPPSILCGSRAVATPLYIVSLKLAPSPLPFPSTRPVVNEVVDHGFLVIKTPFDQYINAVDWRRNRASKCRHMKMSWRLWWMVAFKSRWILCLHSHCVINDQPSESVWHMECRQEQQKSWKLSAELCCHVVWTYLFYTTIALSSISWILFWNV